MTRAGKPLVRAVAELVAIVGVAVALALTIQAYLVKPYEIPSGSMLPTLAIGQRVLVDRMVGDFGPPRIGQIYVFHPPASQQCASASQGENQIGMPQRRACDTPQRTPSSLTYIKRVVGLPGDVLRIENGQVIRDGVPEPDPYAIPCRDSDECDFPGSIRVPAGDYYMMGDNRPDSLDSRFWGPVPRAWLIGRAFFTYWPPDRVGTL